MLTLSLKNIISRFPEVLKGAIQDPPPDEATIALPASAITEQLSKGRASITFGKLKELSPEGVFRNATDQDTVLVDLPLQEIIPQLKSGNFVDKSKPAQTASPAVPNTFEKSGPSPNSASKASAQTGSPSPKSPPPPFIKPPTLSTLKSQNLPLRSSSKPLTPASRPGNAPFQPEATPPDQSDIEGSLSVSLNEIQSKWPETILQEIENLPNARDLKVEFPLNQIAPAIQRGRIQFPWSRIRSWLRPAVEVAVSEHDDLALEVPLPVIVPLFLQHQKPVVKNKAIDDLEDIPDLFGVEPASGDSDQSAPKKAAAPAPSEKPAPKPADSPKDSPERSILPSPEERGLKLRDESESNAIPMPSLKEEASGKPSIPAASEKSPKLPSRSVPAREQTSFQTPGIKPSASGPLTLGRVFLQPEKTKWTIQEIVDKTSLMPGVSGALVAMDDGLLVAAKLPDTVDQDTISAFLPRLFQRMTEACDAMGLGQTNQLTLKFQENPVVMIKSGKCFLLVFGNTEYPLPMLQIEAIAKHLEKHT